MSTWDVASLAILLISLIGRVLLDVALVSLLVRIIHALLAARRLIGRHLLGVASSFPALIVRWNRWHLAGHDSASTESCYFLRAEPCSAARPKSLVTTALAVQRSFRF